MPIASDFLGWRWAAGRTITYTTGVDLARLQQWGHSDVSQAYGLQDVGSWLNRWADVSDICFEAATDAGDADIWVYFDAVDGFGGTLGYAWARDTDGDGQIGGAASGELAGIAIDPADILRYRQTLIHEAGHVLGINHIDHTYSVMASSAGAAASHVTDYDAEVAQSLYGTRPDLPELRGTATDDFLAGQPAGEAFYGNDGRDTLLGFGGDDVIYGNRGGDSIAGGYGDDTLYGGQDTDRLSGGYGDEVIYGNISGDVIYGGPGDDTLYGGQDADVLSGGDGADLLIAGRGPDTIHAGGDDTVVGFEEGVDTLVLIGQTPTFHDI